MDAELTKFLTGMMAANLIVTQQITNTNAAQQQQVNAGSAGISHAKLNAEVALDQPIADAKAAQLLTGDADSSQISKSLAALASGGIGHKAAVMAPPVHPQPGLTG